MRGLYTIMNGARARIDQGGGGCRRKERRSVANALVKQDGYGTS